MKAFIVDRYGSSDRVRIAEMPDPELREDELLVQVHAAGVNLLDSKSATASSNLFCPIAYRSLWVTMWPASWSGSGQRCATSNLVMRSIPGRMTFEWVLSLNLLRSKKLPWR
jgi:hypothetical protein